MTILYIILGLIAIGIAIVLIRIAVSIIGVAIATSLMVGMVCGIFYLLGWMESETVWTCMKWAFFVGIPLGIWYVIENPSEAISGGSSSSSSSSSFTPKRYTGYDEDGRFIELEQTYNTSECAYHDPQTGKNYERDSSGNFHEC